MNQYHIDNIINSVEINARNCIVSMHKRDDEIIMTFLVENEYVATEFRLLYDLNFSQIEYLGGTTYHDNLESRTWFINAVKKIEKENGYRYAFCFGGHDFSFSNGRLVVNGDFKSKVMFEKDGCSDHFDYNIDFAKRKLEFNHVCPFHEFYEFFC